MDHLQQALLRLSHHCVQAPLDNSHLFSEVKKPGRMGEVYDLTHIMHAPSVRILATRLVPEQWLEEILA